jgi:hypothetical protein
MSLEASVSCDATAASGKRPRAQVRPGYFNISASARNSLRTVSNIDG